MRLTLGINAAGDIRLRCLTDTKHSRHIEAPPGALLVCSPLLAVPDKSSVKSVPIGFGRIAPSRHFTRYARTFIRELGAVVDRGRRGCTVFLTGTLPGSTQGALAALAAFSGWVTKTIKQWFRDRYTDSRFFGVWEFQRRGALHLHVCVQCPDQVSAMRLRQRWKAKWIALLDSVSERSGVDLFACNDGTSWKDHKSITRTDAQIVEKSVGCYLGKYLSKGSCKKRTACQFPPSAWWFADTRLRLEVKQSRKEETVVALHLAPAIDLWERIGSLLAELVPKTFAYTSPYNCQVKGLISLAKPIQASLLFDGLVSLLRVLGSSGDMDTGTPFTLIEKCMLVLSAVKITDRYASNIPP